MTFRVNPIALSASPCHEVVKLRSAFEERTACTICFGLIGVALSLRRRRSLAWRIAADGVNRAAAGDRAEPPRPLNTDRSRRLPCR